MKTHSKFFILIALAAGLALGWGGCGKAQRPSEAGAHKHEHHPPHGGTPVVLGDEAYHLELVRDAEAGTLSAYVLDGEMEEFIRAGSPAFEVAAKVGGTEQTLVFKPVANAATGETVTDTALYEASAPWLKTTGGFDAVIKSVAVRGTVFENVAFNFPKGNDKD
ncbi:MAG: hypothetical protein JF599_07500 [Verrucomicrobia bacterium]|nr:hypothetical protein [Verrucomicrobiota bacterium]